MTSKNICQEVSEEMKAKQEAAKRDFLERAESIIKKSPAERKEETLQKQENLNKNEEQCNNTSKKFETQNPYTARAVTAGEFVRMNLPIQDVVIGPFMREREVGQIYAARGAGKTLLSMQLGVAAASGTDFLGFKVPKARKVVYFDGEMPASLLRSRIELAMESLPDCNFENVYNNFSVVTPDMQERGMLNLSTEAGRAWISSVINCNELIFFDSLLTLMPTQRMNDAESFLPIKDMLFEDIRNRGKSAIILHHCGKNGTQLGTIAKEIFIDFSIRLDRIDQDSGHDLDVRLTFDKNRSFFGKDAEPKILRLNNRVWSCEDVADWQEQRVLEMYSADMTQQDIATELKVSQSTISRILKKNGISAKRR